MPFLFTDEQRQISREARRLLSEIYSGERLKALLETEGGFDHAFWAACQEMGWTGITVAEAHGGLGLSAVELCLIALECGRVAAGAPFLATSYAVSEALRLWGDAELSAAHLPGLATGELKGAACLNPDAGLRFEGGRVHGAAGWIVGGAAADVAVVLARDPEARLLLVDLRGGRVRRTPRVALDNTRCVADLRFDGAAATALGAGDSLAAAADLRQRLAIVTAFEQLGGAETCMETARDYALQRHAFGQPIGKFQAIKHKIAEMFVLNELARGNALRAALSLADDAPDLALRAGCARLSAIAAYEYAAAEAIQVHGALGVTWEHDLHLHYRRARATATELGSRADWEDLVVDVLSEAA
ncbi:MAG TPA: acyl-CoA dehydrogenase family protein [Phenylobacterium sp.]|nr:acyl-CoA dehydrogenase family protein [Phenylobacterium sp.]